MFILAIACGKGLRKQLKVFDDALTSLGYKKGEVRANASDRESFAMGWAAAVKQKVKDISPTPAMLDKYVQDVTKGRDLKPHKPKKASESSDAFGKIGYAMGQSADLNRGVDQGKRNLAISMASCPPCIKAWQCQRLSRCAVSAWPFGLDSFGETRSTGLEPIESIHGNLAAQAYEAPPKRVAI
jgi:hypothetical protein